MNTPSQPGQPGQFSESAHPRAGDGKFATKAVDEAGGVDLAEPVAEAPVEDSDDSEDTEEYPPSPMDDCVMTVYSDMAPGDTFLREEYSPTCTAFIEVEVTGPPVAATDRFGRAMENLPCRRLDTGEAGPIMFGPGGAVRKVPKVPRVTGETTAWEAIRVVAPGEPQTMMTGPEGNMRVTVSGVTESHVEAHRIGLVAGEKAQVTFLGDGESFGPKAPAISGAYRVVGDNIDRTFAYDPGNRHDAQWNAAAFVATIGRDDTLLLRDSDRAPE